MKKKNGIRSIRDWADGKLLRLCGCIPPETRLVVIIVMLLVFGFCSTYVFLSGICCIFSKEKDKGSVIEIEHIEAPNLRRQTKKESIHLLNQYDYVQIQKKDESRHRGLA